MNDELSLLKKNLDNLAKAFDAFYNALPKYLRDEKELLTADERADVLNAVNEVLEKFVLEVCGYEYDGTYFDIEIWRR